MNKLICVFRNIAVLFFLSFFVMSACQQDIPEYKGNFSKKKISDPLKDTDFQRVQNPAEKISAFPWYKEQRFVSHFSSGTKVWTPLPVNGSWKIVNFSQGIVIKNVKGDSLIKSGEFEFMIPSVMLIPVVSAKTEKKHKFKKGDFVLANIGMTSEWGKITGISGKNYLVGFVWGNEITVRKLKSEDILLLKSESPGSPVVFKVKRRQYFGKLIYKNNKKSWIIGFGGKVSVIGNSKVRFPPVTKRLKKGRIYRAPWFDEIIEIKILSVLKYGLGYKVKYLAKPEIPYQNPRILSYAKVFSYME